MEIFKAIPGIIGPMIWDSNKGPVENLLGLVDLGMMIIPSGITQLVFVISNVLGLNGAALGRYIDKTMGWKTLGDLASDNLDRTVHKLTGLDKTAQNKVLTSFRASPMSALSGMERNTYDGMVHTALKRRFTHPRKTPSKTPPGTKPDSHKTPLEKAREKVEMSREVERLNKVYKPEKPFFENFNDIVMNGGGLFAMLSKMSKVKFTPGLIIVAITGLIKWVMSMSLGLAKFMMQNKKTGLAMLVGATALASHAYYKWFAGDDASEEDINKGVESGANIFGEKVRNGLDSLAPEKRDFRGTLEYLIDGAMIK